LDHDLPALGDAIPLMCCRVIGVTGATARDVPRDTPAIIT
jgi:hypothetical protein